MRVIIEYTAEEVLKAFKGFQKGYMTGEDQLVVQQVLLDKLQEYQDEYTEENQATLPLEKMDVKVSKK